MFSYLAKVHKYYEICLLLPQGLSDIFPMVQCLSEPKISFFTFTNNELMCHLLHCLCHLH